MRIPDLLGVPAASVAEAPLSAPEGSSWWEGPQVRFVLGHAFRAFREPGHLDAVKVAQDLGVVPGTVRRWGRTKLPEARRVPVWSLVAVPADLLDQERIQARNAMDAAATLPLKKVKAADWHARGWTEPHVLYLVWFSTLGVWIPRIGRLSEKSLSRVTAGAGGGRIFRRKIYSNYFEAQVAKFELLEACKDWRVQLPREGSVTGLQRIQGRSSAVLDAAPLPVSGFQPPAGQLGKTGPD